MYIAWWHLCSKNCLFVFSTERAGCKKLQLHWCAKTQTVEFPAIFFSNKWKYSRLCTTSGRAIVFWLEQDQHGWNLNVSLGVRGRKPLKGQNGHFCQICRGHFEKWLISRLIQLEKPCDKHHSASNEMLCNPCITDKKRHFSKCLLKSQNTGS